MIIYMIDIYFADLNWKWIVVHVPIVTIISEIIQSNITELSGFRKIPIFYVCLTVGLRR